MALSIKRRVFLAPLIVIAISLALCLAAWVKDAAAERVRLLSYQANSYVLTIQLAPAARDAAKTYILGLDQGLSPTSQAYLTLLDRHTLRDFDGQIIGNGDDMAVLLMLLAYNPPPAPEPHLVLIKGFISNGDLVDYLVNKSLIDVSSTASEINITHEVKRDEDGTKVKSKFLVLDPDGTIRFKTEFMQPEPYHEPAVSEDFVAVAPFKVRYGFAADQVFEVSQGRTVFEPPPDVFINLIINLDPSNPEGAIFNNPDNVITRFRFAHLIQAVDEIIGP